MDHHGIARCDSYLLYAEHVPFQRTLYKTVAQDLYYNSHNVADQISTHIKSKTDSMADLADALARMPEQVITKELLYRKTEAFDMDLVSVFHKGGYRHHLYGGWS